MSIMFSEKEKIWQYLQLCFLKCFQNKNKQTNKKMPAKHSKNYVILIEMD